MLKLEHWFAKAGTHHNFHVYWLLPSPTEISSAASMLRCPCDWIFPVLSPARHSPAIHSWWRGPSANAPERGHSAASAHLRPRVTRTRGVRTPPRRGAYTLQTFCALYLCCREARRLIGMCRKPSRCFCFPRPDAHRRRGERLNAAVTLSNNCERRSDVVIRLPFEF